MTLRAGQPQVPATKHEAHVALHRAGVQILEQRGLPDPEDNHISYNTTATNNLLTWFLLDRRLYLTVWEMADGD